MTIRGLTKSQRLLIIIAISLSFFIAEIGGASVFDVGQRLDS